MILNTSNDFLVPAPDVGDWYLYSDSQQAVISDNEFELALHLKKSNLPVLDRTSVAVKVALGQVPVIPSVLSNVFKALPLSNVRLIENCEASEIQVSGIQKQLGEVDERLHIGVACERLQVVAQEHLPEHFNKVAVFLSGGWDSRLELALLLRMVPKDKLVACHMPVDKHEYVIAKQVAESMGIEFSVFDATSAMKRGIADEKLRIRCLNRSTWRPTTVLYSGLADLVRGKYGNGTFIVGFGAYALKGRNYDSDLNTPPKSGRYVTEVPAFIAQALGTSVISCNELQLKHWQETKSTITNLDNDKLDDYLTWALRYGTGYSHRVRYSGLVSLYGSGDAFSIFTNTRKHEKQGIAFVRSCISLLEPKLLEVPVLCSDGAESYMSIRGLGSNEQLIDLDILYDRAISEWIDPLLESTTYQLDSIEGDMHSLLNNDKLTNSQLLNLKQVLAFYIRFNK